MAAAGPFSGMPFAIRNPRPELLKIRNRKATVIQTVGVPSSPLYIESCNFSPCMLPPISSFRAEVPMQRSFKGSIIYKSFCQAIVTTISYKSVQAARDVVC